uniref:Uncharacterized protein n=5 Tax=Meloidogyne TaxID=189290 RepID=A0A6V7XHG7_MELEN|nr:unnamed protein product [Meloidogyne enterolobii]CAD2198766.1 unnamed protein product [Meloidogyne enterolobii]
MLRRHRRERERRAGRGIRGRTHAAERAQLNMRERARYVTVRTFDNVEAFDRWWDNRKHRWKINKRQRSPDKVDEYWRCSYAEEGRYFVCGCCIRIRKPTGAGGPIEAARSINVPHRHAVTGDMFLSMDPFPMETAIVVRVNIDG